MQKLYVSKDELQRLSLDLKLKICPRCKCTGTMILHGKVYGYADTADDKKTVRGQRIFCNNRKKRKNGCGHTFTVWADDKLKHACLGAHSLWRFLKNVTQFANKAAALRTLNSHLAKSSACRLWKRFELGMSRLRCFLSQLCPPPDQPHTDAPARQTIAHLEKAFDKDPCPIVAFQKRFQASFL